MTDANQRAQRCLSVGLCTLALAAGMLGCGGSRDEPGSQAEGDGSQSADALEVLDAKVEGANGDLLRAARAGDRAALARAESALTALARKEDAVEERTSTGSNDPFERELDRFKFKQAPLFVQQITSSGSNHVLFVSVYRPQFCLKPPAERLGNVREVYAPLRRRLRREGVNDFELIVAPLKAIGPTRADALAVGRRGKLSLTSRGRRC